MLVLVTGGAGFIGSHLVPALLAAGHRVRVLDTLAPQIHGALPGPLGWLSGPGVEFRRGSVTDAAEVGAALEGAGAVIHLAAETGTGQSMYEIARYAAVNVQGTAVLMQALADQAGQGGVGHVILASSRAIYGEGAWARPDGHRLTPPPRSAALLATAQGSGAWDPLCPQTGARLTPLPTREDDRAAPASIYAATKLAQEDLLRIGAAAAGIGHTILRLQNVYGEGQSLLNPYTGILSMFSTRIRRGLALPVFEDGACARDFVHVSDVVAAFVAALHRAQPADGAINVGSGRATPVLAVAQALSAAFGAPDRAQVTGQYRLGDIRHNQADIARLGAVLGLTPAVALEEGLARFAAWVATQPLPEDTSARAAQELAARRLMG